MIFRLFYELLKKQLCIYPIRYMRSGHACNNKDIWQRAETSNFKFLKLRGISTLWKPPAFRWAAVHIYNEGTGIQYMITGDNISETWN